MGLAISPVNSQTLPTLTTPAKGDTVNMSIQSGSKSSLSFGATTSFGVNTNINTNSGASSSAQAALAPAADTSIKFTFGGTTGKVIANIENLKSQTSGIDSSSGKTDISGITGSFNMPIDPLKSEFKTRSATLHETYGAGGVPGNDGKQLPMGSTSTVVLGSAASNANIVNNSNVDINATNFTSVFLQAY
ncbi:hypothetical protein KBY58_02255 [Cyanobium sp. HWJ4-Hawea]|nr:hypothetical protein [Cyanobium sp. HWJ4-Hawea]